MARPTPDSRFRFRQFDQWVYDWGSGALVHHYPQPSTQHWFDRTYSSVTTPEFYAKKVQRARLPTNPYGLHLLEWGTGPYNERKRDGNDVIVSAGDFSQIWGFTPFVLEGSSESHLASNKAFSRLANQAAGVRLNAAQFLAERKQVADLLADTASRIAKAARALKRADLRGFTQALSLSGSQRAHLARKKGLTTREITLADAKQARQIESQFARVARTPLSKRISTHWLEYVYGWRPLLADVHDAAELLAEKIETDQGYGGTLKSSGKSAKWTETFFNEGYGAPDSETKTEYRTRYVANYYLDDEGKALLAQTGISNPLLLGWELLPYSFVIDWFYPVGSYLESLTAFDGFVLNDGSVSHLKIGTTEVSLMANVYVNQFFHYHRNGGGIVREVSYTREALSSWPSYVLKVRSPLGGNPQERFATAFSLMRVLFKDTKSSTRLGHSSTN